MKSSRAGYCVVVAALMLASCKTGAPRAPMAMALTSIPASSASVSENIRPVGYQEPISAPTAVGHSPREQIEFPDGALTRAWLQAEIETRNPSLEAMVSAWQAAMQLYPQRVALDDPLLMGMIAPQSAASSTTETAYAFQLNQKLPWFGKRSLRGQQVAASADAAFQDVADARLQVRLSADLAFYEYYLAGKLLMLNEQNVRLMREYKDTAHARYRSNLVTQQDVLQGELELAELSRRRLELSRMQQVAVARINTLLRRWPDAPLPPPADLDSPQSPADADLLWQTALRQRPDLAALAWRVQEGEAALELAYKNRHPDFDTFARYDTFWQPASTQGPLRAQVGVAMNLPVYREKLRAAICEAQFRLNQRRAEFDQKALDIQYEVIAAAKQIEESWQTLELYDQQLIPTATQNVSAVRANYVVAKATFLDLAQAQRQLVTMSERRLEAEIAYHRRVAELDRAVGAPALSHGDFVAQ
jgi:cobalt-zinc-cadmium efflux system outer membrane protein